MITPRILAMTDLELTRDQVDAIQQIWYAKAEEGSATFGQVVDIDNPNATFRLVILSAKEADVVGAFLKERKAMEERGELG